jgi:hypothetical protein
MPDSLCSIIHKLPKQKGHILIGEMLYISGGMPIVADDWEISSATEKYHKVRDWYDSYLKYNQNNGIRLEDILRG